MSASFAFFVLGVGAMNIHEKMQQEKKVLFASASECFGFVKEVADHPLKKWQKIYTLSLSQIDDQKIWFPCSIKITTTTLKNVCEGDLISFEKKSELPKKEVEEFDLYLAKEGLVGWFYLASWAITLEKKEATFWYSFVLWAKRNMLFLYKKLPEPTKTLYGTIFLGIEKIAPFDELKSIFNYWGITHYLARSGLHIALFIMLWKWLFQLCGFSFFMRIFLLVPILCVYIFLTPISLSFLRGIWAFFLFLGAFYLYRPFHVQHMLYLSAFCILLYNPYALFFLDFQLSFSLTYVLFCVSSVLHFIDEKKRR